MWWSALTGRLEQAKALDPAVEGVAGVADRLLPRGPVKDALHGTWLGHALHPLLIAGPIGLWVSGLLLDLTAGEDGEDAARRLVGAGVLAAVPTAASGLADWSELGMAERPKRVGLVHAAANTATLALMTASWVARRRGDHGTGRLLALAGSGGLAVGGYLGGHLAYSQAVGVNRNYDEGKKPRDWTDACAVADLDADGRAHAEVAGQHVLVLRVDGALHALGAHCSHWSGPLEEGRLVPDDDGACIECPWHGSRFRVADGSVQRGPATSPQLSYDVRERDGRIEVRVRA